MTVKFNRRKLDRELDGCKRATLFEVCADEAAAPVARSVIEGMRTAGPLSYGFGSPWKSPRGVGVAVTGSTTKKLLDTVEALVAQLDSRGVEAEVRRLRPPKGESMPDLGAERSGFVAALVPADVQGTPQGGSIWRPDTDAAVSLITTIIEWCDAGESRLWHNTFPSSMVPRDRAVEVVQRFMGADERTKFISDDGSRLQRHATFYPRGWVTLEVGGSEPPRWQTLVDELKAVLATISSSIGWGAVARIDAAEYGLSITSPHVAHDALWKPYRNDIKGTASLHLPGYLNSVLNVYGFQVFGPGHTVPELGSDWTVQILDTGSVAIAHNSPEVWFARQPTLDLLLSARDDFGSSVTPDWKPR